MRIILLALWVAVVYATDPSRTRLRFTLRSGAPNTHGVNNNAWSEVNVVDFGAVGDAKTDNTAAFQRALANLTDGGVVYVPAGQFLIAGSLVVPTAVTLQGTYTFAPASNPGQGGVPPTIGSVLLPTGGSGNSSATPFIQLKDDSAIRGLIIFYPEQDPKTEAVEYPWTISLIGEDAAVEDVELVNSYNGVLAKGAPRHYIARVFGQPLNFGLSIDSTYDIGRIEDVHFNPWWSSNTDLMRNQLTNGRAFIIARSDWEYVLNTFSFGYAFGYHFLESSTGACNGNFLGIGADLCTNASVVVEASQPMGLLITNGEFTSFIDPHFCPSCVGNPTHVITTSTNTGSVRFVNTAFWGPAHQIADISGSGIVTFSSCNFVNWDSAKKGLPAISVHAGSSVSVMGSQFYQKSAQIVLDKNANKAVIMGNMIAGPEKITDNGAKNVQKGLNASDE